MKRFLVGIIVAALVIPAGSANAVRINRSTSRSTAAASLNGHEVILNGSGKLMPWAGSGGYSRIVQRAWSFLLNDVPNGDNGLKLYYSYPFVNPDSLAPADWPHNPASFNATLTDSALAYSAYSGNPAPASLATPGPSPGERHDPGLELVPRPVRELRSGVQGVPRLSPR